MSEYKLTADELLLFYLTYISQDENGSSNHTEYFHQWYNGGGNLRLRNLFNSLQEKGIILKNYNPKEFIPTEIELNKNFIKRYWKYTGELGQELLQHYPKSVVIDGHVAYLTNVSKRFLDIEDFYFWYASKIGHSRERHKQIIDILDWSKSQNLINFGILEFVGSQKWTTLEELKKQGVNNRSSTYEIYATA